MIDEKLVEDLKTTSLGKWIAVKGSTVVAICDSDDELFRILKEQGVDGAYVFRSPTEAEKRRALLL